MGILYNVLKGILNGEKRERYNINENFKWEFVIRILNGYTSWGFIMGILNGYFE